MKNLIVKAFLLFWIIFSNCSKRANQLSSNQDLSLAAIVQQKQDSIYKGFNLKEKRQLYHTIVAANIIREKIFLKAGIHKSNSNNSECYLLEMTRSVDYAYIGYYFFKNKNLMYKVFYQPSYDSSNKVEELIVTNNSFSPNNCIIKTMEEELNLDRKIVDCENETSYIATKCTYGSGKGLIVKVAFFCQRKYDDKQLQDLMNINRGCY